MTEMEVQGGEYITFIEVSFLENSASCVTLFFLFVKVVILDTVLKQAPLLEGMYIRYLYHLYQFIYFVFKMRKAFK